MRILVVVPSELSVLSNGICSFFLISLERFYVLVGNALLVYLVIQYASKAVSASQDFIDHNTMISSIHCPDTRYYFGIRTITITTVI